MSATGELIPDEELRRISEAGRALYEERLKSVLEHQENNRIVVIHLDSGGYAVDDTYPRALRELRKTHPQGMTVALRIGPYLEAPSIYRAFAHHDQGQLTK